MAIWTVWEHDRYGEDERIEKAVFVRDGFSFLAFLVPPLWLLANGMVLVLIAFLVVSTAAVMAVEMALGDTMAALAGLAIALWFGFEARALRRWALARRGWTLAAVVEGRRFRNAERRYVAARLEERATRPATDPGPATPPPLPPGAGASPGASGPWGSSPPVLGVFPEGSR